MRHIRVVIETATRSAKSGTDLGFDVGGERRQSRLGGELGTDDDQLLDEPVSVSMANVRARQVTAGSRLHLQQPVPNRTYAAVRNSQTL